jgi:Zn finger protein HypA/HybF involved in hydrogenase expression
MKQINEKHFIDMCLNSNSMAEASVKLELHFNTFKKYALKFGCYNTNQSGKGMNKIMPPKIDLQEILEGKHPHFQTFKLKNRLLKEKIIENKCYVCKIEEWNGKKLNMELDHIDGNRTNHKLQNLRMLCPNCHSQTDTYRAKNIR